MMAAPALRAALYGNLAAALADPPAWMVQAGRAWPLWPAAALAAEDAPRLGAAVAALADIPAATLAERRRSYRMLYAGSGRPRIWPYESHHRSGRLMGPETAVLEKLYRAAGLSAVDGELPDHASVELAFLAHLAQLQDEQPARAARWLRLERRFLQLHAGTWLPGLGRSLAETRDPVYGPLGLFLAELFSAPPRSPRGPVSGAAQRPVAVNAAACTLCSFCVPACPTRALAMAESGRETRLVLQPAACIGCRLCVRACPQHALELRAGGGGTPLPLQTLIKSPRLTCSACGAPTVSEAEFNYVAAQVGSQPWMRLCLTCRTENMV